ncbi:MAG: KamA family radical SAM protein [Candidatus Methylacidiphilales bacterium]|nr:KamA family radical SAM protein [Candidatus Methylacidiphilales bacterium]
MKTNEPDSVARAESFRAFTSPGQGHWAHVSPQDWNDGNWQQRNRITNMAGLAGKIRLTSREEGGVLLSSTKLAMGITPYFFNLVDGNDPDCPIRQQVIPKTDEVHYVSGDMADPCGEDKSMPVPGLVHRYPDRVLFLVTDRCASYCRYCTRSRVVSGVGDQELETDFEAAFKYLEEHTEIRDVLLSGGDPLLFSDSKLQKILRRLRAIPHIEFIRIGSRVPIFLPQRITPQFCEMLREFHPLWMSVHVNHPKELTVEVRDALGRLADAGVPLGNQSVLLKGVNDDPEIMKVLVQKLLRCRVRPYYLYQADLIQGTSHLRVPVRRGLEIIESLRGHTTGYAIPQYVIDGPGGGGKIPVNPEYVVARLPDRIILRNYKGEMYEYPDESLSEEVERPLPSYNTEVMSQSVG